MTVIPERLSLLDQLILDSGSHSPAELIEKWNKTACVMEAASYIAGEPWSDSPKCVSPVLTSFGIRLNDSLPEDKRQLLKPFIPDLIGTRDDGLDDARRDMARRWLMAEWLPKWLRLANSAIHLFGQMARVGLTASA